jgi:hypothetical protein
MDASMGLTAVTAVTAVGSVWAMVFAAVALLLPVSRRGPRRLR